MKNVLGKGKGSHDGSPEDVPENQAPAREQD